MFTSFSIKYIFKNAKNNRMNLIGACYNILLRFIKIFKPIYKYIIGLGVIGLIGHK